MVAIPFPTSTFAGFVAINGESQVFGAEGAGGLVNCYADPRGTDRVVWHRHPGLIRLGADSDSAEWKAWSFPFEEFFNIHQTPDGGGQYLGGVVINNTIWARFGTGFRIVDSSGNYTTVTGTVSGSDKTHFARNNAAVPHAVVVCDDGPFIITAGALIAYTDGDVGSPNSVCFHDGYYMFGYGDGTIQASDINNVTIDPLNFTTAESNPDGVIRLWSHRGLLYVAGTTTIEVYGPPINSSGFPLTRQGYNIVPGLMNPWTIAGFEPEFGNFPIYVASDNTVRWLNGTVPEKISTPEIDFAIEFYPRKDLIETSCYISRGHAFWELTLPQAFTAVFNLNTLKWHNHVSYGLLTSRTSMSIPAFGKWLVGDTQSNNLLEVRNDEPREVGDPLVITIESDEVKEFPNRIRVPRADFDFTVGVGDVTGTDPIQTDPTVMISWSDDGGQTWSTPRVKPLGQQAEYSQRVSVFLTGLTGPMGRKWRLKVSDPVHFGLLGGDMSAEVRTK